MEDLAPLYTALKSADAAGDVEGAKRLAAYIGTKATSPAPAAEPVSAKPDFNLKGEGYDRAVNYSGIDAIGGALRGAGSIGATLARPFESSAENEDRRQRVDQNADLMLGANPGSTGYKTTKLLTEIAGSTGVGGALAKALRAVPGVAAALPTLLPAIESAGMTANGAKGLYGMATRVAGGAVNGALTAGAINPEDAGTGMMIGGAAPVVVKGAGMMGEKVGDAMNSRLAEQLKEYSRKAPLNKTIEDSIEAGYVIPPSSVNPSFKNRVLESISGKQATQQIVSTKNNEVTEGLVRKALGLPDDAALSQGTLEQLRKTAGKAYAEVSAVSPQAATDLEALKTARNEASSWFKAYNRSARPDDLAKAKDARALSDQLEQALEAHATGAGKPELIPALRDARQQIAKTYTVSRAINDASGSVDARVLGRMYEKGAPLTSELETAGRFASAFPTAAKTPQQIGSPDVHNLKTLASLLMGGGGSVVAGPVGLTAAAVPFAAPPLARALLLRKGAQEALIPQLPQSGRAAELAALLRNPEMQQMLLRSAPAMGASTKP